MYVVQTFKGDRSEVVTFSSLEFAKKHAALNSGMIFHTSQVSRIEKGYLYLKADDYEPIN